MSGRLTAMRVAIVAENGQLARCLMETIPEGVDAVAFGRQQLDLSDPSAPLSDVFEDAFDIVINAAAFTAVDRAENERDLAFAINAGGPERLARYCSEHNLPVIHISTDYVFDGTASRPYRESDEPIPCNTYGASKLAGEQAIAELMPQHVIIRTSWLYSAYGQNFVKTMLRLARSRDNLQVVADQLGRPTSAHELARAIWSIAHNLSSDRGQKWGLYHYADAGEASWADFAEAIFTSAGPWLPNPPRVERITTAEFERPAPRPAYSVLDTEKIEQTFGIEPPPWQAALSTVVKRITAEVAV